MGMARERQRDAFGHAGENVRLVDQAARRDRRSGFGGACPADRRCRESVPARSNALPDRQVRPARISAWTRRAAPRRFRAPECARPASALADAMSVVPPVVIAEDRPDAERRMQPCQFGAPERIVDRLDRIFVPGFEIAEQDDEVGPQRIRGVDDARDLRQRDVRSAGMQVGDHRDGELLSRRPVRRRQGVGRDQKIGRLDGAGIGAGRARRKADQPDTSGDQLPAAHAGLCRDRRSLCGCRRHNRAGRSIVLHELPLTPTARTGCRA